MIDRYIVFRSPKAKWSSAYRTVFCIVEAVSRENAKRRATPEVMRADAFYKAVQAQLLEPGKTYYL
jgi:hypothetical protein